MGKQWKQWQTAFLGSKITADSQCSHEIKRCFLIGWKAITNLDSILKSRDMTLSTKVCLVKAVVFPVVMYGCESLDHKESWAPKNWCLWTVVLDKALESPFDCKEIQPVHPKGDQSRIFMGRTDTEAETPVYFGHLIRRTDSLETLMLGKIEGRRRRGRQRMRWLYGITNVMWWTWVWASSGSWWWTRKPGVFQSMGSQRTGQDWATELNWTDSPFITLNSQSSHFNNPEFS